MTDAIQAALMKARDAAVKAGRHPSTRKASNEAVSQINMVMDLMYPPAPAEGQQSLPGADVDVDFTTRGGE